MDKDLAALNRYQRDAPELGKEPQVLVFTGSRALVRRSDGALIVVPVPQFASLLYQLVGQAHWTKAAKLCRFAQDKALWAALAAMAIEGRALTTAEQALAALEEVDKLQYIAAVKEIPTQEGRDAALALFRRRPEEAEQMLLQAGLVYRAIDVNISLVSRSGRTARP